MKKFLLIALAVVGLSLAATPSSEAGVSFGIGFGGPVGYYPYSGCSPYGYGYGYSGYGYGYPYGYRSASVIYRPYYWHHGRRIYYVRRHRW